MPIAVTSRVRSGSEELPPAFGAAVKNGDAKMLQMRPERDLGRPYGPGDQLRRDHQSVPALPVANQLGQRRERSRAFAGAERSDQERGVVLVEPGRGALLVRIQDARGRARSSQRRLGFGVVGTDAFLRLQRQTRGPVRQGQHLAPQDRLRLLGARLVDLADDLVVASS